MYLMVQNYQIGALLTVSKNFLFRYQNANQLLNKTSTACTAERFFRVDRAQENLHYVTDIASDVIYVLDQECPMLPQTPDDDNPQNLMPNISSLESSDKDSHDGTPSSPSKKFFNRSLSGPNSGGNTSDSLSPGRDVPSRKSSQGSQGSNNSPKSSLDVSKDDVLGNGQSGEAVVNYKT